MQQRVKIYTHSESEPVPSENWVQRVGNFAAMLPLLEKIGADPLAMIADAGLAPDALDDPENRISYAGLGRLLRATADTTGCTHIGLLVGRMWHLPDLGLLGELVRHSATVGDALRALTAHHQINSEGGLAFLLDRGPVVDLGYAIYQPGFEAPGVMYDAQMSAGLNFMRELCGPGWMPSEVLLPHAKPAEAEPYRRLFKLQPQYNAEICALRFPSHWMSHPVAGADPQRLCKAKQEARLVQEPELLQQVARAVRQVLLHERHSGKEVAQMLALHRRTLNRRLKAHGTTFQKVLDSVRFSMARELLAGSQLSLDDVAATLGYAGVSNFMRSFHRWSGTTPGRWRRASNARTSHGASACN